MRKLLVIIFLTTAASVFGQDQFQNESAGHIAFAADRLLQLANAFPAEKYDWRPADGVRSFGEVVAHAVSANYFFSLKLGAQIPAEVNIQTIEKDLKTKEQLTAGFKASYELLVKSIGALPSADLSKKVEFPFPGEYTSMSAALIGLAHVNQHMGQLVSYCRMNEITPPWSQGGDD